MSSRPTAERGTFGAEMRKRSGAYLRSLRERAEVTQVELAKAIGVDYYTFISQLETGRGFVPPERYVAYAKALGVDPQTFVRDQLRFQNPWAWAVLFGTPKDITNLDKGIPPRRPDEPLPRQD